MPNIAEIAISIAVDKIGGCYADFDNSRKGNSQTWQDTYGNRWNGYESKK